MRNAKTMMIGVVGSVALAGTAAAQTKPRTYKATEIHANCLKTYSDQKNCDRSLDVVRKRYGETVTMMQWNAGVGVVRHYNRTGR